MFWLFGFGGFYFCFKLPLTSMGVKHGQCWMLLEILPFSWFWFCWFFYVQCRTQEYVLEQNNDLLC